MGLSKYSQEVIKFLETVPNKQGIEVTSNLETLHKIVSVVYKDIKIEDLDLNRKISHVDHDKDITFSILNFLRENNTVLNECFTTLNIKRANRDQIVKIIQNFDKITFERCTELFCSAEGSDLKKIIVYLIYNELVPSNLFKNVIDKSIYGQFTSLDIQRDIEYYINSNESVKFTYDGIDVNLLLNTRTPLSRRDLYNLLRKILLLPLIQKYKSSINITYWMTSRKKTLPFNRNIFTEREINSGVTSFSPISRELSIFRKEEYKKLTFHELVHYLDLDGELRESGLSSEFPKNFNINPDRELRIYEAYTEFVGVLLNALITSIEYNEPNKHSYELFKRFLEYETEYSLFQTAKILLFFRFNDIQDFVKEYDGLDRFKYTTDIFSYYFLKTALLCNLGEVLDYIYTYCNGFKMPSNREHKDIFVQLIFNSALDLNYHSRVQYYMDFINENRNNIPKRVLKSLRMTCIEE